MCEVRQGKPDASTSTESVDNNDAHAAAGACNLTHGSLDGGGGEVGHFSFSNLANLRSGDGADLVLVGNAGALFLTDGLEEIRSITGGQSSTISSLKDEAEDMRYKISRLVDIANDRGERIEELEDIIERAQSEVEDLQMHISFDWDNWTLMMDANNIMDVLNEY